MWGRKGVSGEPGGTRHERNCELRVDRSLNLSSTIQRSTSSLTMSPFMASGDSPLTASPTFILEGNTWLWAES